MNTDKLNTLFTIEDRRKERRDRHVYMRIHPKCPRHPSIYPSSQPASHLSLPSAVPPFIHACTPETPSSLHFTPRARSGGVDGGAWARSIVASHPSFSPTFSPPPTAPRLASPWTCHHGRGLQERLLCATVRSEKLLLEEHLQLTLDSTPFNSMHSSLAVLRDDATPAGRPGGTMAVLPLVWVNPLWMSSSLESTF